MKNVHFEGQVSSIRALVDRSLSLNVHTPELSNEQKVEIMGLQLVNCIFNIEPQEVSIDGSLDIKAPIVEGKTPSQRLRSVLFVLWQKKRVDTDELWKDDFETYYRMFVEHIINQVKERLGEYD